LYRIVVLLYFIVSGKISGRSGGQTQTDARGQENAFSRFYFNLIFNYYYHPINDELKRSFFSFQKRKISGEKLP
jgi:hypothetical protein